MTRCVEIEVMRLGSTIIPLLFFLAVWQSPQDTIRQHYESAEAQRLAGNLSAAEAEYTAILAEGYQRLGEVYLAEEDYKSAITVLEPAAAYSLKSPSALINLAIAYFGAAQYDKALEPSQRALVIDPNNAGAHQMLGKTYFMLGDLRKSVGELETAARLAPTDIDVVYTLGIAYLRDRQPVAARQLYDSMIKQFGDRPQLHVIIGRAYRQSGLLSEATEEFKKAIALDPHFPRAHYYLGITYLLDEGQSKIREAEEEFKIEMAANPDEFFANYYLGVVYIYQRKWDLAITSLQKASNIEPNNPDPYFQLGQAYQELNRHEEAVDVLRKAIAFNPDLAHNKNQVTTAHHRLAQSLLKLGQTDAGQKELQFASDLKAQAFKLEQQVQTGAQGMGGSGKLTEPEANSRETGFGQRIISRSIQPDAKTTQQLKSSADYYQKILATAHNNVGLLRAERKDFPAAAEQFALAVKWNPEQEGLDYNLGLAYYKSELYDRAIAPLEKELKIHPANRPARLLLSMSRFDLGKALLQRGDTRGAIDNLERAAKLDPEKPDFHLQLGQAYISAGRKAEGNSEIEISRQLQRKMPN
jgi:tetratricopeptide (TPR) repeat protein